MYKIITVLHELGHTASSKKGVETGGWILSTNSTLLGGGGLGWWW